jgi:4-amino-4-deoxy-L-arabinose transferase-like glycosyltransferase
MDLNTGLGKRRTISTALESPPMLMPARTAEAPGAADTRSQPLAGISTHLWILAGLIVLGAALRFATLTTQSFWYDESLTVHELHGSFGSMWSAITTNEITPPLYFVLAWPWAHIFGTGEAGLRSLSAVIGTATIPIAYLCGRELVSRTAGLFAAAFAAVCPFLIWYSQEARAYGLFIALGGLSFLFFARAWNNPSNRNLAWWAVCSSLVVLTHFFAGFVVAPEALLLLWRVRRRASVFAVGAVVLVQAALLPMVLSRTSAQLSWVGSIPLSIRVKQAPVQLALGSLYQSSLVTKSLLATGVLAVIVLALVVRGGGPAERRGAALAAAVAGFAVLAPLLLAVLGRDYFIPRNLAGAWVPLAVLLAAACAVPRARIWGGALAAVVLVGFVIGETRISQNRQYQKQDWRAVAAALGPAAGTRAIVASGGNFAAWPLSIYMPGIPWDQSSRAAFTVTELDVVGSSWQAPVRTLPPGMRLIGTRSVSDFLIERFSLQPAWQITRAQLAIRGASLLTPIQPSQAVLVQSR